MVRDNGMNDPTPRPSVLLYTHTKAITIFLTGGRRYKKQPPKGSIITTATQVIVQAAWATIRGGRRRQRLGPGREGALLDGEEVGGDGAVGSWLDRAKRAHGGSFGEEDVEGVKYVCRLLPFLLFLMPYWVRGGVLQMDWCILQFGITYAIHH